MKVTKHIRDKIVKFSINFYHCESNENIVHAHFSPAREKNDINIYFKQNSFFVVNACAFICRSNTSRSIIIFIHYANYFDVVRLQKKDGKRNNNKNEILQVQPCNSL